MKTVKIGNIEIGRSSPVFIAGPCVIEDIELLESVAEFLSGLKDEYPIIMKFSYDKANRSSADSFRGPGIEKGVEMIAKIKDKYGLPVLVDVHCRNDVEMIRDVADCIQIPAFLCRQTDLLIAAARTGKAVNIKKGQFMSPWAMALQAEKVLNSSNDQILLTERGTTFGYDELVVDMRAILVMKDKGYPVFFDATHSQQRPPKDNKTTGGRREFIIPLAKAAIAVGAAGIYCEIHPNPEEAKSDRDTQLNFEEFKDLVNEVSKVR